MVNDLYFAWIKIDESLPWIELKGSYETKDEAQKAAKEAVKRMRIRIVQSPEQKTMKPLAAIRTTR